jgi:hypothetical protein
MPTPGPWTPKVEERRHFCHQCRAELDFTVKLQRTDACPHCGVDLHVCKNCQHWEATSRDQCAEPIGEFVRDRDRANHCAAFTFAVGGPHRRHEGRSVADSHAALAALFDKKL